MSIIYQRNLGFCWKYFRRGTLKIKAAYIYHIIDRIFPYPDADLYNEHHGLPIHSADDLQRTSARLRPISYKLCRTLYRPYAKMSAAAVFTSLSAHHYRHRQTQTPKSAAAVFVSHSLLFFRNKFFPHFQTVLRIFYSVTVNAGY